MADAIAALRLCREIVKDELDSFIDSNSEHTKTGKKLDRQSLTGYELADLERLERALAAADEVLAEKAT
jgi:hypothetical protein